jgi:hypothetical protein
MEKHARRGLLAEIDWLTDSVIVWLLSVNELSGH